MNDNDLVTSGLKTEYNNKFTYDGILPDNYNVDINSKYDIYKNKSIFMFNL